MSNPEVVEISRRTVFILIAASLAINMFFLLLGILIGREDTDPATETGVTEAFTEETVSDPVAEELSVFQDDKDFSEPKTVDPGYLDASPSTASSTPEETVTAPEKPPVQQSTAETSQPKPEISKPSTNVKTSSGLRKGIYVQIAAVGDGAKASAYRDKIARGGYISHLVQEGNLYKVLVGPYDSKNEAEKAKNALYQKYKASGWVRSL